MRTRGADGNHNLRVIRKEEPPMHTRGRLIPGVKGSVVSHDALCTWRRISAIASSAVMA